MCLGPRKERKGGWEGGRMCRYGCLTAAPIRSRYSVAATCHGQQTTLAYYQPGAARQAIMCEGACMQNNSPPNRPPTMAPVWSWLPLIFPPLPPVPSLLLVLPPLSLTHLPGPPVQYLPGKG